jgi:hypothetical protein
MLKEKIIYLRFRFNNLTGRNIIQFSPIRSGSTLVFNILRELFPTRNIQKTHAYRKFKSSKDRREFPIVVTYRHPLDCIASSIQRYNLLPTDSVIKQQVNEFNRNGGSDILEIKRTQVMENILMLRYEDFSGNIDVILSELESFFKISISTSKRKLIHEKYRIESIEKIVQEKICFSEYDPVTHWHGNHISKYKGDCFYYKDFFCDDQIAYLKDTYKDFLMLFDYT